MNRKVGARGKAVVRGKIGNNPIIPSRGLNCKGMSAAFADLTSLIEEYTEIQGPMITEESKVRGKIENALVKNDINLLRTYADFHKSIMPQLLNISHTNTLLHRACKRGNVEAVIIFLRAGANPNITNKSERTPLHKSYKYVDITRILISHNAKVNIKDTKGFTPLHRAAIKNNIEVVRELILAGGDLHILDNFSKMPIDYIIDPIIKKQIEKIFMWRKSKIPLFAYKFSNLKCIPESLFRYMLSML